MQNYKPFVSILLFSALAAVSLASAALAADIATLPPKQFSHPDRVRYDGQCLTIDGQDIFLFSGAFHYFRVPKDLWRDRFASIKAAGFNAVETYVPWNWSERQMPDDVHDTSHIDLNDLRDWLHVAQDEFGLYTIVRPGPYICAEWEGGGFPQWLWAKQPSGWGSKPWVRTDDPTYLAWVGHWMDAVWPVVAEQQITRKPKGSKGVVLVQIENEYDLIRGPSEQQRVNQLHFLYDNALKNGIDVPIFVCVTKQGRASTDSKLSQVFESNNYYHRWNLRLTAEWTQKLLKDQPNAPAMISELQGGWFAEAGGKLPEDQPGVDARQCNAITLTAIANGATLINYYMLVGGSNFGSWGGGSMLQSYDYNAPIREAGGRTEKYAAVSAIGKFLQEFGPALARAKPVESQITTPGMRVEANARRDASGTLFIFFRNPATAPLTTRFDLDVEGGQVAVDHTFPPQIITVLVLPPGKTRDSDGQWCAAAGPTPHRPAVSEPVRVVEAWTRDESGPTLWRPVRSGQTLIQSGVYDVGDVVYRSEPALTAEQAAMYAAVRVGNDSPSAEIELRVNEKVVAGRKGAKSVDFPVAGLLREGRNTIDLLYENHGVGHFGDAANIQPGVTGLALLSAGAAGKPVSDWRVALADDKAVLAEVAADFDDSAWAKIVLDQGTFAELAASRQPGGPPLTYPAMAILRNKNATAVYRATIDLTDQEIASKAVRLELGSIDDRGEVFVNGKSVGQSVDWHKPFSANVSDAVHPGRNVIAVRVVNTDGEGGIVKPVVVFTDQNTLPLDGTLGTSMAGVVEKWWNATDLTGWTKVSLDTARPLPPKGPLAYRPDVPTTLQKWVHAEFELPDEDSAVWVPWGAVIHASGNGFLYLNGHELGRYYDIGPQRRFYLPSPWLKRGAGQKNVLTLCLTAAGGEPGLLGCELSPYADQAELRSEVKRP